LARESDIDSIYESLDYGQETKEIDD